jgi:hypothetical protein
LAIVVLFFALDAMRVLSSVLRDVMGTSADALVPGLRR